jgi:hypothetical protein
MRLHRCERFVADGPASLGMLLPADLLGRGDVRAYVNARREPNWDYCAKDGEFVHFLVMPGAPVVPYLVTALVSIALSYAVSLLFPPPDAAKDRDDEASATYGFNGIGNNRVEGLPIPVVYGRMRTGGQVINEWVQTLGVPPTSTLYTIYSLGEGPFEDIGGVTTDTPNGVPLEADTLPFATKINGNAADNFDDVEMWVRLGTNSQETVTGFSALHTPNPVGQDITTKKSFAAPSTDIGVQIPGLGAQFTTARDPSWDKWGVSFDVTTPSDQFIARIGWPQGLYWTTSGGDITHATFRCQFRYRELDGSDLPITTGGPNGDGWVRLRDENTHFANIRTAHEREYKHTLIDPQSWVIPSVGNSMDTGTANGNDGVNLPWAGTYDSSSAIIPEFSVSFWLYTEEDYESEILSDATNQGTLTHLVGNMPITWPVPTGGGASFGINVALRRVGLGTASSSFQTPEFRVGGTEGTMALRATTEGEHRPVPFQSWELITCTYKANAMPDGSDRLRIYRNASLAMEGSNTSVTNTTNVSLRLRGTGAHEDFTVCTDKTGNNDTEPPGFNGNMSADARVDDLCFYNEELTQSYIQTRFDSRLSGPDHNGMIARWKFDDTLPADQDIFWPTQGQVDFLDATINGTTSTSGTVAGIVESSSSPTFKRMKFRLELLRVDLDNEYSTVFDDPELVAVDNLIDEALQYPNLALVATKVRATEQLNTSQPVTTFLSRGALVPHWNGVSEISPDVMHRWSHNPAWIALDLILNGRYGLGQVYKVGDVDLPSFLAWANYADEIVYDGSAPDLATLTAGSDPEDWDDIRFDNSVTGPDPDDPGQTITRGMLRFVYALNVVPASNYAAGLFVNITGAVTDSDPGIDNDINNTSGGRPLGGYEIIQGPYYNATEARYVVEVYWDRTTETDPWTTNTLMSAHVAGGAPNISGTLTSAEHRFAFNGVFDNLTTPWDALLDVCAVGRAVPIRQGKRIRIRYAHPQNPAALISRGSLVDGKFSIAYTGPSDKPNAMEIGFLDESLEFERNTWLVLDPTLRDTNAVASVSEYRLQQHFLFGVTSRSQAERHGTFMLNANRLLKRSGTFTMPADGLHLEVNDVVYLSHDIIPRGVSGRVLDDPGNSTTTVVLDQPFEIDSGGAGAYTLYVRDATTTYLDADNAPKDWESSVLTLISPGSYPAGTQVSLVTALSAVPIGTQTTYALVKTGDEMQVEITRIVQNEDLTLDLEWVEYNALIFDDTATQGTTNAFFDGGPDATGTSGTVNSPGTSGVNDIVGPDRPEDHLVIDGPYGVTAREVLSRQHGGGRTPRIALSWAYLRSESLRLKKTAIYARRVFTVPADADLGPVNSDVPWEFIAEAGADQSSIIVALPAIEAGDEIEFAIQAVTVRDTKRRPDRCVSKTHTYQGLGTIPRSISGTPSIEMDGRRVRYNWGLQQVEEETAIEIRRGGWILGQVVHQGAIGEQSTAWLDDFATGKTTFPQVYFAPRTLAGFYGAPTALAYTPDPDVEPNDVFNGLGSDDAWEAYSDGWITDSTPPTGDPNLNVLQRHADGYLEFPASGLTGTYTTQDPTSFVETPAVNFALRPQSVFVEASVIAEQVHPRVWGEDGPAWGDPEFERWTWEGPLHTVGEEANCTLKILWKFTRDGTTWTDWRDFRPGEHEIVACQFRLSAARPTNGYNLKIHNFATIIRIRQRSMNDMTPAQSFLEGETLNI